jgi:uncharacterized repeat protein (TIGR03803 family)
MTNKSFAPPASTAAQVFAIALALLFSFSAAVAQAGETVIHRFNKTQGSGPLSGLTSDSAGNLYGTTYSGGAANCGTVFELSPSSGGTWTEAVLYSFTGCTQVTQTPRGTLAIDKTGNLFGVLQGYFTSGLIFELLKGANGTWSYTVVHNFGSNEGDPNVDLTWDSAGNLYGTTSLDSTGFDGEAFELSSQPGGSWKETVLYSFNYSNAVSGPNAGVIFDSKGNLYGPYFGGSAGFGGVYELSPQANGTWMLTVVYNFTSATGGGPYSKLTFDTSGNLYGTANQAGPLFVGEVFKLTPTPNGQWTETTIHTFNSGNDGAYPQGTLVFDASGNLYGTTLDGGLGCNQSLCGTVFKLTPRSNGTWKETILHQFESAEDGSEPQAGLLLDSSGNLYGTTSVGGGRYGYGTVFEITP